jgi:hypothetical protein
MVPKAGITFTCVTPKKYKAASGKDRDKDQQTVMKGASANHVSMSDSPQVADIAGLSPRNTPRPDRCKTMGDKRVAHRCVHTGSRGK